MTRISAPKQIPEIANTPWFHFAMIEQAGTSLSPQVAQRVTDTEVVRILLGNGPFETMHLQTRHDKAGNASSVTDPTNGLVFPDLISSPFGGEDIQANLIMPEPTVLLNRTFPDRAVIRPTESEGAAMGAMPFLTDTGLFRRQSSAFFAYMTQLPDPCVTLLAAKGDIRCIGT